VVGATPNPLMGGHAILKNLRLGCRGDPKGFGSRDAMIVLD